MTIGDGIALLSLVIFKTAVLICSCIMVYTTKDIRYFTLLILLFCPIKVSHTQSNNDMESK